jgi:threonine/homoserine/homoserine lactone efflux protein
MTTRRIFLDGFSTGLLLQMAVGPVFFYVVNITLQKAAENGFAAVIAVTIADYLYIILAILGTGKLFENVKVRKVSGISGSIVIAVLGTIMFISAFMPSMTAKTSMPGKADIAYSFLSTFLFTISNPLTIVFWTGIFTARAYEKSYSKKQSAIFGLSAGVATPVFLGASVLFISFFKTSIPPFIPTVFNAAAGILLVTYGIKGIIKARKMEL